MVHPGMAAEVTQQRRAEQLPGQTDQPIPDNNAADQSGSSDPEDEALRPRCAICYEMPTTYGLLPTCDHPSCTSCLQEWRTPPPPRFNTMNPDEIKRARGKKQCPLCRTPSRFVVPSSFYAKGKWKARLIDDFKHTTKKKPCKHFEQSKRTATGLHCPFAGTSHFLLYLRNLFPSLHCIGSLWAHSKLYRQLLLLALTRRANISLQHESIGDATSIQSQMRRKPVPQTIGIVTGNGHPEPSVRRYGSSTTTNLGS